LCLCSASYRSSRHADWRKSMTSSTQGGVNVLAQPLLLL